MLEAASGGQIMQIMQVFLSGFPKFKSSVTSVDGAECLGCPLMSRQVKMRIK
jgi:hypothetical protein